MENNDVIIVGSGPAGAKVAEIVARSGYKVLLFEKNKEVGASIRCGELVNTETFKKHIVLRDTYIRQFINKYEIIVPDGKRIAFVGNKAGMLIDRSRLEPFLVGKAKKFGAKIITNALVTGLEIEKNKIKGVQVRINGRDFRFKSRIVVAADGVSSQIAKFARVNTTVRNEDAAACICATVVTKNLHEACNLYFGKETAPGGYAWLFSQGRKRANIGVGITKIDDLCEPAKKYFDKFLKKVNADFGIINIENIFAGGLPLSIPLKRLKKNNLLIVGDAARQTNPLTGAGINASLIAGSICGEVINEALRSINRIDELLTRYERIWNDKNRDLHLWSYDLRKKLNRLNDNQLIKNVDYINEEKTHTSVINAISKLTGI